MRYMGATTPAKNFNLGLPSVAQLYHAFETGWVNRKSPAGAGLVDWSRFYEHRYFAANSGALSSPALGPAAKPVTVTDRPRARLIRRAASLFLYRFEQIADQPDHGLLVQAAGGLVIALAESRCVQVLPLLI